MSNTIIVKNSGPQGLIEEKIASAAGITPGALLEEDGATKAKVHATAKKSFLPMFAIEDSLQGKEITDTYAKDDPMRVWYPFRGSMVYALLKQNHAAVAIGAYLTSAGDGTLQAQASGEDTGLVGMALEATTQVNKVIRIKIRIL